MVVFRVCQTSFLIFRSLSIHQTMLGYWVNNQRDRYRSVLKQQQQQQQQQSEDGDGADDPANTTENKNNSSKSTTTKTGMSDERIAQLNELGFNWNVKGQKDGSKGVRGV